MHRLSPSHVNIHANVINDTTNPDVHNPTPLYNNAILRNFTPKSQLLTVHALQKDCAAFADALALLRIWANQRGYSEGTRMCVRGFEGSGPWWCSVLALLLTGEESRPGAATKVNKRRTVGKGVSSYQLFKAASQA
jgi:U3 small nucleolar RNA-associated protein 22